MLNASTEIPAAPRVGPRQPQPRDAKPAPAGFSSLVDDNAAAKPDASRARSARDTEAARASAPQPSRDNRPPRDTDRASSPDETPPPEPAADKPVKADKAEDETAIPPAPAQAAPVAAIVDPTVMIAAAKPAEPAAVAVAVLAAPPVAVATAAPAPLAIAAAGIAAAKAATTKATDATAATDADQTAIEAPPAGGEAVAPPAIDGKPKAASTEPVAVKIATGFADTRPPEAAEPSAIAKTDVKAEAKTATKTDAATPPDAAIADGTKPTPAHIAVAHDQRPVAAPALPADANANGPQPVVPQPAPHAAAAVSPTAQLTATVATAAPVPLNGLAVELASRAQSGASRFDIRLDPAELGRIDVRIDVDRNGQVTSHLTVEKPETLAMLRQDSPQLQRALNDAGLKTADGALQFTLGDQSQPRQNTDGGERQAQRFVIRDDETVAPTPVRGYGRMLAARSGVDISV